MIRSEKSLHYLVVMKLYASLRGPTSKHHNDFYCFDCLDSFSTKNNLKSHEKRVKTKIFVKLFCQHLQNNISEFNQYMKLDKLPYVIYADSES